MYEFAVLNPVIAMSQRKRMRVSALERESHLPVPRPLDSHSPSISPHPLDDHTPLPTKQLTSHYFSEEQQNDLRLGEEFFNQQCVNLARAFLGKILVRRLMDGTELRGRVVETEAYLGGNDKASHSAGGKCTERNMAMFMKPGTIYVYQIYGIYLCMNVSSQEGAAVLLRSLEPLQGQAVMRQLRSARRRQSSRPLKDKELCNGPSKLCQALDISRAFDRRDLVSDAEVWLERDPLEALAESRQVVAAPRIGIEAHGEWAVKPLRFYLQGHPCVSVVDRDAERRTNFGVGPAGSSV
ncbi:DNA-3-methyladenine glycosylase isoform X2 [Scleropages formosus]|uniref:DNA-3-methyladenine glycosylase isoform X2 n=1 Tax=Scleropages formosus TaxID=113540 RepID=UPI000878FE7E|nr:DNA-3-methyladenine glycosylase isoform X2 [Scleropages formosus]